ncbi:MAG: hypothetical protein WKG07_36390 [Hymenobacter sp.]
MELRAQVTGFVTGLFSRKATWCPAGKALYDIDKRQYQAAYRQALANLRQRPGHGPERAPRTRARYQQPAAAGRRGPAAGRKRYHHRRPPPAAR